MTKDTGGQAFPVIGHSKGADDPGMELRDYFAGQALVKRTGLSPYEDSVEAYRLADAMIAERGKA